MHKTANLEQKIVCCINNMTIENYEQMLQELMFLHNELQEGSYEICYEVVGD